MRFIFPGPTTWEIQMLRTVLIDLTKLWGQTFGFDLKVRYVLLGPTPKCVTHFGVKV
jgi:hypothetical protein